ncbi:MAG TPA: serine/threonine-protein kinase, partial [Gemmatimonadales bacterium]|nr:serine/threonine-protein kinase [Gemmatimonadales bacterium]
MTCGRCGASVAEGLRYCGYCGAAMQDPLASRPPRHSDPDQLVARVRAALSQEYHVESELARGGMGVVFKAREVERGRPVAIKVLTPELALHERAAERFKREARTVAELDHPGIVPVYRVGRSGEVLYIAMKFIDGRPLGRLIEAQGALPVPVVVHVLRSAAQALSYAHARGIVHRDVKADNILIDQGGHALMTDFGVALRAADVTLTIDGAVVGTPAYMSPEQCFGSRAGPQSDQYSLGVVAFVMLAGSAPFASETIAGYIQQHLSTPVPDMRPVRDDLPEALVAWVTRALAKDPRDRFETTQRMVDELEAVPISAAERREAQDTLRRLGRGEALARVSA